MKRSNLLSVVLSGTMLVLALALTLAGPAGAQSGGGNRGAAPVTVVNETLQVTGTVDATQSGTWNVGVTNSPASPVPVRNVDVPMPQPFMLLRQLTLQSINTQQFFVTVPPGKRLVIEHVSWWAGVPVGNEIIFAGLRKQEFGPMAGFLQINPPHASADSSFLIQDGAQPTRWYFEAGDDIWMSVSSKTGAANTQIQVVIAGYFVDVP